MVCGGAGSVGAVSEHHRERRVNPAFNLALKQGVVMGEKDKRRPQKTWGVLALQLFFMVLAVSLVLQGGCLAFNFLRAWAKSGFE